MAGLSIRGRLTLIYTAAMVLLLLIYALGTYGFVRSTLFEDLDDQLDADAESVASMLAWADDASHIVWRSASHDADPVTTGRWVQVWRSDGTLIDQTPEAARAPLAIATVPHIPQSVSVRSTAGERWRMLDRRAGIGGRAVWLRLARDEESLWSEI